MRREAIADMRALLGHAIFGATFVKADGTLRTGRFRLGVRKGVKGVGQHYDTEARGNLIVYDVDKQAFRTIKLDRLVSLRAWGESFEFARIRDDVAPISSNVMRYD